MNLYNLKYTKNSRTIKHEPKQIELKFKRKWIKILDAITKRNKV